MSNDKILIDRAVVERAYQFASNEDQHDLIQALGVAIAARPAAPEGPAYGIIDPDYARVYTQARIVAWQYGYACVMHGSFTRDLDLLLVPWAEHAQDNHDQLIKLIAQGSGLRFLGGNEDIVKAKVDWTEKPHGRKSCSLYFPEFSDRRWVDISVLPRTNPLIAYLELTIEQLQLKAALKLGTEHDRITELEAELLAVRSQEPVAWYAYDDCGSLHLDTTQEKLIDGGWDTKDVHPLYAAAGAQEP